MAEVVWRRAEEVAEVDSGDRVALVSLATAISAPELLTGAGAEIWRALVQPTSETALAQQLADTHGVPVPEALGAVSIFLGQLHELGLALPA